MPPLETRYFVTTLNSAANIQKSEGVVDERLYHFREVCKRTLVGELDEAYRRMVSQAMFLQNNEDIRVFRVFLNTMNQAHYHLFLNDFDLSLHELCYENGQLFHTVNNWEEFLDAGKKILTGYCKAAQRLRDGRNHAIIDTIRYIRTHLDEDLSLAAISDVVYLNPSYLCTLFREITGQTINSFIQRERMRQAERLLMGTDLFIEDIAKSCGFHSAAYFSTVFRKHFRMKPSEYRLRARSLRLDA